jgi:hypothetical protein
MRQENKMINISEYADRFCQFHAIERDENGNLIKQKTREVIYYSSNPNMRTVFVICDSCVPMT